MSAGLVTCVALLGALAGAGAPAVARRLVAGSRSPAAAPLPVPSGGQAGPDVPGAAAGTTPTPHSAAGRPGVTAGLGALVFGGLAAALGADPALPAFLLVAASGLVLALVDLACLRLPDPLVAAAALGGGLGLAGAALAAGTPGRLLGALAGAALSLAAYVVLALLPGARLGFGDVKLAAALGLPLGWSGWPTLWLGLLLPHLLNGLVVLVLLAARRIRRDAALPFGPAILAGAWLAVLLT